MGKIIPFNIPMTIVKTKNNLTCVFCILYIYIYTIYNIRMLVCLRIVLIYTNHFIFPIETPCWGTPFSDKPKDHISLYPIIPQQKSYMMVGNYAMFLLVQYLLSLCCMVYSYTDHPLVRNPPLKSGISGARSSCA
jgi:hypothetical protein